MNTEYDNKIVVLRLVTVYFQNSQVVLEIKVIIIKWDINLTIFVIKFM